MLCSGALSITSLFFCSCIIEVSYRGLYTFMSFYNPDIYSKDRSLYRGLAYPISIITLSRYIYILSHTPRASKLPWGKIMVDLAAEFTCGPLSVTKFLAFENLMDAKLCLCKRKSALFWTRRVCGHDRLKAPSWESRNRDLSLSPCARENSSALESRRVGIIRHMTVCRLKVKRRPAPTRPPYREKAPWIDQI